MRTNSYARFTRPSIFDNPTSPTLIAEQAIREGEELRRKLEGKRILSDDHSTTQMAYAFKEARS